MVVHVLAPPYSTLVTWNTAVKWVSQYKQLGLVLNDGHFKWSIRYISSYHPGLLMTHPLLSNIKNTNVTTRHFLSLLDAKHHTTQTASKPQPTRNSIQCSGTFAEGISHFKKVRSYIHSIYLRRTLQIFRKYSTKHMTTLWEVGGQYNDSWVANQPRGFGEVTKKEMKFDCT